MSAPLKIYLSGGSSNSDPDASLGGDISTTEPSTQPTTWETSDPPAGDFMTLDYCFGLHTCAGQDDYSTHHYNLLVSESGGDAVIELWHQEATGSWHLIGSVSFPTGNSGQYTINALTYVEGDIGGVVFTYDHTMADKDKDHTFFVTNPSTNMFKDITAADSRAGKVDYRWIYYKNLDSASIDIEIYLPTLTNPDDYELGLNIGGVNDAPPTLTNEITAPDSGDVVFSSPTSGSPLESTLTQNDYIALCIKRIILAGNLTPKKPSILNVITSIV